MIASASFLLLQKRFFGEMRQGRMMQRGVEGIWKRRCFCKGEADQLHPFLCVVLHQIGIIIKIGFDFLQ